MRSLSPSPRPSSSRWVGSTPSYSSPPCTHEDHFLFFSRPESVLSDVARRLEAAEE